MKRTIHITIGATQPREETDPFLRSLGGKSTEQSSSVRIDPADAAPDASLLLLSAALNGRLLWLLRELGEPRIRECRVELDLEVAEDAGR